MNKMLLYTNPDDGMMLAMRTDFVEGFMQMDDNTTRIFNKYDEADSYSGTYAKEPIKELVEQFNSITR